MTKSREQLTKELGVAIENRDIATAKEVIDQLLPHFSNEELRDLVKKIDKIGK